jgi:DNA-binding GntR family transcriptional regulator
MSLKLPAMAKGAYDLLKARITSGELNGGTVIDIGAVASARGISRTPVREALLPLANERFVEIVPRHAVRVVPVSMAHMALMHDVKAALEVFAVELIAR